MTSPPSGQDRTALELIAECVARLRAADPAETATALLAAWHGFGIAEAAGSLLAQDNPNDAILARNARPVLQAAAQRLRAAPSLPYTDAVVEPVDRLAPERYPADGDHLDDEDLALEPGINPADAVRRGILTLAFELNALLPQAARHARDPADSQACRHGSQLAYELTSCWEGRFGTFLNRDRQDP